MLDLLSEVFGIGVAVEVAVGGGAEPVGLGAQLIREVGVVILGWFLLDVGIGVGGPAAEGEVAAGVFVSGLYVLVVAAVAWEV